MVAPLSEGCVFKSSSEGCVFKSHLGQLFSQFLRVDAFDIISVLISVHARKGHNKAWWRNGSASDSSSEGCEFKSLPGKLLYQFLRVDALDIICYLNCYVCMQGNANMRPGGATVARMSPVEKVACSNRIWVNYFISFSE